MVAKSTRKKAKAKRPSRARQQNNQGNLFTEILAKGIRSGQIPARTDDARKWYRNTAKEYKRINESKLMRSDVDRLTARALIGNMYLFGYDAKHKLTLPYWDRFPLIFPFKRVKGGFLGINLHYLPLLYRAELMDALYDITTNDRYDETTKLRIKYKVLAKSSKFKNFKPCVKHYLTPHLRSRFFYIYPSEWDIAIYLPVERFQKARKTTVWAQSKKMIGK